MTVLTRDAIFISHAYPEDNAFTVWPGARLTAAGYEVGPDVLRPRDHRDRQRLLKDALRNKATRHAGSWLPTARRQPGCTYRIKRAAPALALRVNHETTYQKPPPARSPPASSGLNDVAYLRDRRDVDHHQTRSPRNLRRVSGSDSSGKHRPMISPDPRCRAPRRERSCLGTLPSWLGDLAPGRAPSMALAHRQERAWRERSQGFRDPPTSSRSKTQRPAKRHEAATLKCRPTIVADLLGIDGKGSLDSLMVSERCGRCV